MQTLCSSLSDGKTIFGEHLGVFAELYKLNIYSAPSGGQLRVGHNGVETLWDWSSDESIEDCNTIHWAAIFSYYEHEVLEVKKGHRITVTYNLYVHERIGTVMRRNPIANPRSEYDDDDDDIDVYMEGEEDEKDEDLKEMRKLEALLKKNKNL
ncbi:MAG: hypothetical protein MMC33_003780, partial [Icmadophila ericetorum]|nr:hypothetical protein [Icmadophila ericetorum]